MIRQGMTRQDNNTHKQTHESQLEFAHFFLFY